MITSSAAFMGKSASDDIATISWNWASMARQQFLVLHHGHSTRCALWLAHNQGRGDLYGPKCHWLYRYHLLKMSVNGAWTIFGHPFWIIYGLWNDGIPQSTYQLPVRAQMVLTILQLPPAIERPPSVNNFCGGSVSYTAMNCMGLLLNWVLHGQSF